MLDGSQPGRPRQRAPRRQPVLRRMSDRYGLRRGKIIKDDWKSILNDDELDHVLKQMLHHDDIHR